MATQLQLNMSYHFISGSLPCGGFGVVVGGGVGGVFVVVEAGSHPASFGQSQVSSAWFQCRPGGHGLQ